MSPARVRTLTARSGDEPTNREAYLGKIVGSLMGIFEMQTATGREDFACQDRIVSQNFILLISNEEEIA